MGCNSGFIATVLQIFNGSCLGRDLIISLKWSPGTVNNQDKQKRQIYKLAECFI